MSKRGPKPPQHNRWEVALTLTFDLKKGDLKVRHHGDTEADFGRRAFERVRPALNGLLRGNPFAHYQVTRMPRPCAEAD